MGRVTLGDFSKTLEDTSFFKTGLRLYCIRHNINYKKKINHYKRLVSNYKNVPANKKTLSIILNKLGVPQNQIVTKKIKALLKQTIINNKNV